MLAERGGKVGRPVGDEHVGLRRDQRFRAVARVRVMHAGRAVAAAGQRDQMRDVRTIADREDRRDASTTKMLGRGPLARAAPARRFGAQPRRKRSRPQRSGPLSRPSDVEVG